MAGLRMRNLSGNYYSDLYDILGEIQEKAKLTFKSKSLTYNTVDYI